MGPNWRCENCKRDLEHPNTPGGRRDTVTAVVKSHPGAPMILVSHDQCGGGVVDLFKEREKA